MRNIIATLLCIGFTIGAVYQQMHHLNSDAMGIAAAFALIFALLPDALFNVLADLAKQWFKK